jgi:hypothetical protein
MKQPKGSTPPAQEYALQGQRGRERERERERKTVPGTVFLIDRNIGIE